jgi:hypothetical protein
LPHPGATDCSSYGYIVGFRVKNKFGDYGDTIYHSPKIISNPDNTYTLIDIGLDTTIVIYKMTDACGNTSYSTLRIVVQDKEAPSANCEGFIVVSLKENGWAELSAESVNSGSTDNCKIVKLEVRRLSTLCPGFGIDTTFKSSVNFCCEDINPSPSQYIKVVLRVTDASGNSNECISNVKVQDKIPPVFTYCPPNITLECYEDYRDFNLTGGTATATDNCGVRVLAPTDTPGLNKCGIGTVTRRWTARDSQGLAVQCTQIITLINSTPFSEEHVIFPKDTTVNTCYNPDQLSPDFLQSKPYLHPQACADLAISYTDDYYQVDNACHKIIRTWRVIDWCTYSVNNSHFIYKTQVILVKDLQGPTVTFGCTNRTISAQDDCSAIVHHRIEATDNCTPANLLRYSWEIDLFNNQTIDDKGFGPSISDTFPAGSHKMIFRVVDGCGNETICRYDFVINNNKKPTPVCLGEVAWVLDKNGRAEIWAKDFDLKSESFCGVNKTLRFSFTQNVRDSGRVFTCANIPNGVSARIPIRMYVFDSNNNFDFCDVTLVLQDSPLTNACPNNFAGGGMISGLVVDSRLQKAESVGVVLEDITDKSTKKVITNSEGKYEFTGTEFNKNYVLKPEKMDDVDLGVNTLDLVTLQRHILGIQRLNSPYHLIAADVDNDQKITLSDLIALRRIILGISNELPNNRPWRFVPRDFKFDENKPFDLREIKVYDNLEVDDMAADFMMIKVGDVDAAYNTNGLFGRSSSSIPVYYEREEDKINFFAGANMEMSGLEMSFTLNTFGSILPGVIDLNGNEAYFEGNKLKLSWVSKTNSKAIKENDLLFTLISSSNKDAGITNLQSEFYSGELETFDINLLPRSNAKGETRILSFPNPFVDKTMLSYYVEKDGEVIITIYDQQGKSIYNNKLNAVKGENKITIHRNDLPAVGMYLLNVNTSTNSQTIKLMLVD